MLFWRELRDLTENKVGQPADIGCPWTCRFAATALHTVAFDRQEAAIVPVVTVCLQSKRPKGINLISLVTFITVAH